MVQVRGVVLALPRREVIGMNGGLEEKIRHSGLWSDGNRGQKEDKSQFEEERRKRKEDKKRIYRRESHERGKEGDNVSVM